MSSKKKNENNKPRTNPDKHKAHKAALKRTKKRHRILRKKTEKIHAVIIAALLTIAMNTQASITIPEFDIDPVTVGPIVIGTNHSDDK